MSDDSQYDPFIKDPNLLLDSCRVVIDHLSANLKKSPEIEAAEAQLKEISYSIERLEKIGVSIPDSLRQEKIQLSIFLSTVTDNKKILMYFADELKEILIDLNSRLNDSSSNPDPNKSESRRRVSRRFNHQTDNITLEKHLVIALEKLGGSAIASDVISQMSKQLEGKFLPGDLELADENTPYWRRNAYTARLYLVKDGVLKKDSPHGVWELNEEHL